MIKYMFDTSINTLYPMHSINTPLFLYSLSPPSNLSSSISPTPHSTLPFYGYGNGDGVFGDDACSFLKNLNGQCRSCNWQEGVHWSAHDPGYLSQLCEWDRQNAYTRLLWRVETSA